MTQERIRNFSIIAHIDHGKSTLADRLLEYTKTLTEREMQEQFLDNMDLERERGITIKLQAVTMNYQAKDGKEYYLNVIDTPGHVDFTYEVSRSLKACEGVLLVVDAAQGIEAQTLANIYLALEQNLEIIPVINKIDLPNADVEKVTRELEEIVGIDEDEVILASAKDGTGIEDILEAIVERIPAPDDKEDDHLKALIFDSYYDTYRGVITYLRVFSGQLVPGMEIKMMQTGKKFEASEIGILNPGPKKVDALNAGEVGFMAANIKDVKDSRVGDTITSYKKPAPEPLAGYKQVKPMVYCGLFPADGEDYEDLRDALDKLQLNDASLVYEQENSAALGFGFRCGFLGLLHMEIIQERLEREYGISLVTTAPNVVYRVELVEGEEITIENPTDLPERNEINAIYEPVVRANFMVPQDYIGPVMELCEEKRGEYETLEYLDSLRVLLKYKLPLSEIVFDFFDLLKSKTRGYASFDYEIIGYEGADLVKVDILVNKEPVDALSFIVHQDKAYYKGRQLAGKLREMLPRQMFDVPVQAAIGNKVIARETVKAVKKNVLAKCYGGDITRKRKLLEKQKEGKQRMKQVGKVDIPQEAFMAVLSIDK
ncbi:translation elongation factor 4 [Natranaerobius thermophilus]|uniref:Elongation factor 4 n=1 Tax=Natranaerobius thermophilus (strain ATCC BAA-1301 / DSM 18059 / JW/NM-WN-LF) TaxID=457570 RepID=B2A1M2_NATTJ|nr:translation elongation factor 4 [Natranaerobius thermophilus]ACB84762.1 GTP-binding protein LepA [Natranaerobius thermophilus JW/NM-WN-LF]